MGSMSDSAGTDAPIVAFLKAHPKSDPSFPHDDVDYYRRYVALDEHLNRHVHPVVNQGAAAHGDGWLTDHGYDHIKTVLRRASDLITSKDKVVITPYETFLLATAIHFHDVGNVFGRDRHERQITTVMAQLGDQLIGGDGLEKRMIRDIAMAHGGYVDSDLEDKDTIGRLPWQPPTQAQEPRVRLLAALLRFADELADDYTRTNRFVVDNDLLQGSEIYHIYADRLRQVLVRSEESRVRLQFELAAPHATTKYRKGPTRRVYPVRRDRGPLSQNAPRAHILQPVHAATRGHRPN